jgi:hypothetical protein
MCGIRRVITPSGSCPFKASELNRSVSRHSLGEIPSVPEKARPSPVPEKAPEKAQRLISLTTNFLATNFPGTGHLFSGGIGIVSS